ncbi:universal stress protein [Polaromonas sp. LjRoot131]|uniref:universal stress protein n=1 Tax=Polaromonas sp. LjRoot131 TaxID=3342262 RepID=UPI003ECD409B
MYQRILVPIDGSPTSKHGLQEAIRMARLTGGKLRLLHVVDDTSIALSFDAYAGYPSDWLEGLRQAGESLLADAKAVAAAAGVGVETVLRDNFALPVHELIVTEAAAWPADLIVLGTHGRRGIGRVMLGSSAENVLRRAPVPVLLVRSPEPAAKQDAAGDNASVKTVRVNLPSGALSVE